MEKIFVVVEIPKKKNVNIGAFTLLLGLNVLKTLGINFIKSLSNL